MAGFTDLVTQAMPAIVSDGCQGRATEGTTWRAVISGFVDNSGTPIDLTTVTGTCTMYDKLTGGATVTTLTVTGAADGTLTLYKDEAATAGLAANANGQGIRVCWWSLLLSDGTDTVCVWNTVHSKFVIEKAA